ncbi:MAG: ABC-type multidrug transport system ATPase subunit [Lentimonas sp.]|jgi:ABC-type multidrug transport system ATPase subunit
MNERILRALMQLFAIIAKVDDVSQTDEQSEGTENNLRGDAVIETFLQSELNSVQVQHYLSLYEEFALVLTPSEKKKDGRKKRNSVNSTKVLRICSQINKELTQVQKVIVLMRIVEFINVNEYQTNQEIEFANTVAETFNISNSDYEAIQFFLLDGINVYQNNPQFLYVTKDEIKEVKLAKNLTLSNLDNDIRFLRFDTVNLLFFKYLGKHELYLNGQLTNNLRAQIFSNGASLKTLITKHVYYSDIISSFLKDRMEDPLTFKANSIQYNFNSKKIGLQKTSFHTESGNLIGVMGGSGTGKSTFLNLMNGSCVPTYGNITINGIDIHKEKEKIQGLIGFVSQDDLLIEELSVYNNLYYNTKLCFRDLSDADLKHKVNNVLDKVGLLEVKSFVVGSPLKKMISGGQRKRLNIALELIREPAVLFVDEPTSGLSSRDSENIMDLLKELTLSGKLIFVVIHQPSSEIFKMFDRLLILDQGGHPIFDGNPIDAVVYFKTEANHVNAEQRECHYCGNVNPEQIFNIIEAKVVDEYGNLTSTRKVLPEEWYLKFTQTKRLNKVKEYTQELRSQFRKPTKLIQYWVYFLRDSLSKMSNKQYLLVNFLEAPILALILTFILKFYDFSEGGTENVYYSLYSNENIPQYIFISVIVAIFLGMTVAAEEIVKDRHILKREKFLNLSRGSYLLSKITILFIISALQTGMYVLIGNTVLEIKGLWFEYWFVLFSVACLSNLTGLIISASFNSAKVIYIAVPLLIIPQLIFSGVIVKFDKLHPSFSNQKEVPFIGNIMASRWAYEALAVTQFTENKFGKYLFDARQQQSESSWKRDFWIPEMNNQLRIVLDNKSMLDEKVKAKKIIINEIGKETKIWKNLDCIGYIVGLDNPTEQSITPIRVFLAVVKNQYNLNYNKAVKFIDDYIGDIGSENYELLRKYNSNEKLGEFVTNRTELNRIVLDKNYNLVQKVDPIYFDTRHTSFFDSPFYASHKYIGKVKMTTLVANTLFLWSFLALLYLVLYYSLLRKAFTAFSFSKH